MLCIFELFVLQTALLARGYSVIMLRSPLVIFVSIAVVAKGSTLFPNSASVAEITNVNPAVNTVVKSHSKGRSWHKARAILTARSTCATIFRYASSPGPHSRWCFRRAAAFCWCTCLCCVNKHGNHRTLTTLRLSFYCSIR